MTIDAVGSASSESFQEANIAPPTENSDILGIIFPRLPITDLLSTSKVSKKWHKVAQKELFSEARSLDALKTYSTDTAEKQLKTRRMVTQCLKGLRGQPEARIQAFRTEAARILVVQLPESVPADDPRDKSSVKYQRQLYPLNSIFIMLEVVFDENYKPENNPNSGYQFEHRPPYISVFNGLADLGLVEEAVKAVQKSSETLQALDIVIPNLFELGSQVIRMAENLAYQSRKEALQLIDKLKLVLNDVDYAFKSQEILRVLIKLGEIREIDLAEEIMKKITDPEVKYSALIEIAVLQYRPELLDQIKPEIAALQDESLKDELMDRLEKTQTELRTFHQAFEKARKIISSQERFQILADLADHEAHQGRVGSALKCLEMISGEGLDGYRARVACTLEQLQIEDKYQRYRVLVAFDLMAKVSDSNSKAIYEQKMVNFWGEKGAADSRSCPDFDAPPSREPFLEFSVPRSTFDSHSDEGEVFRTMQSSVIEFFGLDDSDSDQEGSSY